MQSRVWAREGLNTGLSDDILLGLLLELHIIHFRLWTWEWSAQKVCGPPVVLTVNKNCWSYGGRERVAS